MLLICYDCRGCYLLLGFRCGLLTCVLFFVGTKVVLCWDYRVVVSVILLVVLGFSSVGVLVLWVVCFFFEYL